MSTLRVDEIVDSAGTGPVNLSQGFEYREVDYLDTYVTGTGGFGTSITTWAGIEIYLGSSTYLGIARVEWSHSSGFTTQATGTITGITISSITGAICAQNGRGAWLDLIGGDRLELQSATVGSNDFKEGMAYFKYTKS